MTVCRETITQNPPKLVYIMPAVQFTYLCGFGLFFLRSLKKCGGFEYVRLKMAPKGKFLLVERLFGFQWLSLTAWSEKNYSSLLFTPKYPVDKKSNTDSKLKRSRFDPYKGRKLKLFGTQDHPRSPSKMSRPNSLVCKCLALFL